MSATNTGRGRHLMLVGAGPMVPAHIVAALDELSALRASIPYQDGAAPAECAAFAQRAAVLSARLAGWWSVLAGWVARSGLPWVFGSAALQARDAERERARFWRRTAQYWHDWIATQPPADVERPVKEVAR